MNPLFISGIGRSGTSAVLKSLAKHQSVVEPIKLGEAPFVTAFLEFLDHYEMGSPNSEYNKKNYCLESEQQKKLFSELIVRVQCGLNPAEYSAESLWIAKTSLPEHAYEKAEELFGTVRCVHIMRNGVEVVNSAKKFEGFKDLSFEALCKRWSSNIENCKFLQTKTMAVQIRHDKLVSDPVGTYRDVYIKLNIPHDDGPAGWISQNLFNSSFDKTQSGMNVNKAFRNRLNDAWNEWTSHERSTFLNVCGDLMEEYEFDIPSSNLNSSSKIKAITKKKDWFNEKVVSIYDSSMKPEIFNYICNISKKHNYVYINNAKVASTSILKLLQHNECVQTAAMLASPHVRHKSPLLRPSDLAQNEQERYLFSDETFRFSFVRDPFSRILSAYKSKIERPLKGFKFDSTRPGIYPPKGQIISLMNGKALDEDTDFNMEISFHEFVEIVCAQKDSEMDIHWKPQRNLLCMDTINFDFIGKFERLEKDILHVVEKLGLSNQISLEISKNRTGSSVILKEYYTSDLSNLIAERYNQDFETFEYNCDIKAVAIAV